MYQHVSEYLRMTTSRFVPERSHRILFGAAAAALVLTVVLVLIAWSVGHDNGREELEGRLASLQQQLRELSARPAVPGVDTRVTDLVGRIARLEAAGRAPVPDPKIIDELAVRVEKLETANVAPRPDPKLAEDVLGRVAQLEATNAAPKIDPKLVEDVVRRVAQLESASAAPRTPVTDPILTSRLATLEGGFKSFLEGEFKTNDERVAAAARRADELGTMARDLAERGNAVAKAIADLSQRVAEIPPPSVEKRDLDAVAGRIVTLERTATAIEAELARRTAAEQGDRAARLALFATALDVSAARGEPLEPSLLAIKGMGADPGALAALEPFASTGVPAATVLGRELLTLLPALAKSVGTPPREGGILDRLAANAEKLVRIRPVDDGAGDEPHAVLARVETLAAQSDIAGALAALRQLPATARPIAAPWMAKAEARVAALAASRQLAVDTLAALGKGR